ncbi:hypothetical protein VULLAG_LOCUS12863 [Vulpes lagopus]
MCVGAEGQSACRFGVFFAPGDCQSLLNAATKEQENGGRERRVRRKKGRKREWAVGNQLPGHGASSFSGGLRVGERGQILDEAPGCQPCRPGRLSPAPGQRSVVRSRSPFPLSLPSSATPEGPCQPKEPCPGPSV